MEASFIDKIMPKILLWLKPFILWFDHMFTIPFSVKLINADHYYIWKPKIKKGMVFVSDTWGQGSNLINPSKGKHGAIYFGTGLKTFLKAKMAAGANLTPEFIKFYNAHIETISDEIEYVIEALGHGVTATSVIKFLTTKDVVHGYVPSFCNSQIGSLAAETACDDLGLPYDYEFNGKDNAKYCFEVLADAYVKVCPHLKLPQEDYLGYEVYTSSAFKDDKLWIPVIDSKKDFPELYDKK